MDSTGVIASLAVLHSYSFSAVWRYFTYDAVPNKSTCLVEKDGHQCGKQTAGKNVTNLMNHLKFNQRWVIAILIVIN